MGLFDLDESEEDEDDLLQRTGNFISTSTSLPRGILKVRVVEVGPIQLLKSILLPKLCKYGYCLYVGLGFLLLFALIFVRFFFSFAEMMESYLSMSYLSTSRILFGFFVISIGSSLLLLPSQSACVSG